MKAHTEKRPVLFRTLYRKPMQLSNFAISTSQLNFFTRFLPIDPFEIELWRRGQNLKIVKSPISSPIVYKDHLRLF